MLERIHSQQEYNLVLTQIDQYIIKATNIGGFNALSDLENNEFMALAELKEHFEQEQTDIEKPSTTGLNTMGVH